MCVFCGQDGKSTKEHVWAKWLRKYPAYDAFIEYENAHGQRFVWTQPQLRLDDEDRYRQVPTPGQQVNTLLPFVTVPVCRTCNNGWMSRLEIRAEQILNQMILGQNVTVTSDQQSALAAWVTKAAYAYASTYPDVNNTFTPNEYQEFTQLNQPPGRVAIWMGHSTSAHAYIGMAVIPLDLFDASTPPHLLGEVRAGGANVWLAAHSVVFIAHWLPAALADVYDDELVPSFGNRWRGLTRIWPPGPDLAWPTQPIPDKILNDQMMTMVNETRNAASAPLEGQSLSEIRAILQDSKLTKD